MTHFCALALPGTGLVVLTGGRNPNSAIRPQFLVYDLRSRAWGVGGTMLGPRQMHGCGAVRLDDGRVVGVVAGGKTNSGSSEREIILLYIFWCIHSTRSFSKRLPNLSVARVSRQFFTVCVLLVAKKIVFTV